jgi:hypothetical protein
MSQTTLGFVLEPDSRNGLMQMSIFSSGEAPASLSPLRACEKGWTTRVATSPLPILPLLAGIGPAGWFGNVLCNMSVMQRSAELPMPSGAKRAIRRTWLVLATILPSAYANAMESKK